MSERREFWIDEDNRDPWERVKYGPGDNRIHVREVLPGDQDVQFFCGMEATDASQIIVNDYPKLRERHAKLVEAARRVCDVYEDPSTMPHDVIKAYRDLRDVLLEAEVGDE